MTEEDTLGPDPAEGGPRNSASRKVDLFEADSIEFESYTSTTEPISVDDLIRELDSSDGLTEPKRLIHSFAELLEALPVPTLLVDQSDRILFANRSWKRISTSYEKLRGRLFSSLFSNPNVADKVRSVLEELLETRKAKVSGAVLEVERSKIWSRIYIRSMSVGGDRALLILVEDITSEKEQLFIQRRHKENLLNARDQLEERVRKRTVELKRINEKLMSEIRHRRAAEEGLKASRSGFTSIVEKTGEGIAVFDPHGRILYANPASAELLGRSPDQLIAARRGRPPAAGQTYEIKGYCEDGEERVLEMRVENTDWNGTPALLAMLRDITERKRAEKELLKAEKLQSLELIAGGIAHDFNNLLTGITANMSLARMRATKDSPVYDALRNAEKAAAEARNLTLQLLTFTKREAGPVKRLISLSELLKQSAALVLSGSSVKYTLDLAPDLWNAQVDPQQISQVVQNLLINAQQAMPDGGTVRLSAENHLLVGGEKEGPGVPEEGEYVRIAVEDNGPGMSPDVLSRVFDPYFTTKSQGSGLGLSTAYSIVKKHGGDLEVRSEIGKGTTFVFFLPASLFKVDISVDESGEIPVIGRGRILLMDDEEMIRVVASELLRLLGYEVTCAADGAEAIELYTRALDKKEPFSVVIMDLTVPGGMGGKTAIEKLREIDPNVRAIVSSGYSTDPVMSDYRRYGFQGIVPKPYNAKDLYAALEEVLRSR
jgi:PAS domain S-box-containing protein